jgi:putative flippase GtrA
MRLWRAFLPVLAGTAMLMMVVVINGRPSVFTDTDDYFVTGHTYAYGIAYALGIKHPDPPPTDPEDIADAQQTAADLHMSHTEIGARSPYYGLLLYGTQRIGTIWLTTLVQAAIGAWLVFLLWRTAAPRAPPWTAYATLAAVAFGSTLPFFAAFAMPDVFAGYAAASCVLLLVFWDRLKPIERLALAAVLCFSMVAHTSHLLNTIGMVALAAPIALLLRMPLKARGAPLFTVIGAVLATLMINGAYKQAVEMKTGDELRRPPFLAFRVIADGPGRDYLRYACPRGAKYVLCQFKTLPLVDSQDMLWSDDRSKGIFNVTTFDNRLKMEQQENDFVLHAVAYEPLRQAVASMENWGDQLSMDYLDDPLKNPHYYLTNAYWSTTNLPWLINHAADCGRDHWGCSPRLTIEGSEWLFESLEALGLLIIGGVVAWLITKRDFRQALRRGEIGWDNDWGRLGMALVLLLGAVLINGFVCGALSGPFARYQARITWLITIGAALALTEFVPAETTLAVLFDRVRAWPPVRLVEQRVDPAFLRFGLVGCVGFCVHAAVLQSAVSLLGVDHRLGWLMGFAVAVTATWLLNRSFTFRGPTLHRSWRQVAVYVAVQSAGAAANFAVYNLAILAVPALLRVLPIPLAMGSIAGLGLTFLGSKHIAFRPAKVAEVGP